MVVDLDTEKVVSDISDMNGVHGVATAPELDRGTTSNGDGTLTLAHETASGKFEAENVKTQ